MSAREATYGIVQRVHVNRWDDRLQQVVPGWEVSALWAQTGTLLPVFVPDTFYTPENVDKMIRDAGALDEQIHALGRP